MQALVTGVEPTASLTNRALWIGSPGGAFYVGDAPVGAPSAGEVLVRVHAIAVNPVDAVSGLLRRIIMPRLAYPAVMGSDVAGEIVAVGDGVTRLRPGDRVLGHAAGQDITRYVPTEGAFQRYVVLLVRVTSPIPQTLSYEEAAVLPLALSTAAAGLFERNQLALALPQAQSERKNATVLVWGGSTSVGNNAIQLARNAGYDVIATCSPDNAPALRALGAERCFDYRDPAAASAIVAYLAGRELAGTVAIGAGALGKTIEIAARSRGSKRVASAYPGPLTQVRALIARRRGVRVSAIWGGSPLASEVGPAIYAAFLPDALADGRYVSAPRVELAGEGLEAIPGALERIRRGVRARKLVVRL